MKRSQHNLERLRATRAEKSSRGEPNGRLALGYRCVRGNARVGTIEADEDMLRLIAEARRMRADGHSVRTIRRVMTPKGLVGKNGRALSVSGLWEIVRHGEPQTH